MKREHEKHQALSHYDQYLEEKKILEELKKIQKLENSKRSILKEETAYINISSIKLDCLFTIEEAFKDCFFQIIERAIVIQKHKMNTTLLMCEEEVNYTKTLIQKEREKFKEGK